MKWTEPKKPTDGVSFYDHTIAETPIGRRFNTELKWN